MPDGKPTKRRKSEIRKRINTWMPTALKLDIKAVAKAERRSVSQTAAGLIRLGMGRYFELADARKVAPLRKKMRDLFSYSETDPFPPTEQTGNYLKHPSKMPTRKVTNEALS